MSLILTYDHQKYYSTPIYVYQYHNIYTINRGYFGYHRSLLEETRPYNYTYNQELITLELSAIFSILSCAALKCFSSISIPMNFLFSFNAATPVVA
jgi:hypothetical protein